MIGLLILGILLFSFGGIIICTTIPPRGWGATWDQTKEDFHTMLHNPRFQASLACIVIGFLLLCFCLFPLIF